MILGAVLIALMSVTRQERAHGASLMAVTSTRSASTVASATACPPVPAPAVRDDAREAVGRRGRPQPRPHMRPTIASVRQAAARLAAVGAPPTPIFRSEWIDKACGCSALFKAEHLQRTGSFKYRGATNAVGALDDAAAAKGVVAHSSGNHGAAVAAAAAARGVPCTVVVPSTTPEAKVANMERYGARVVKCEPTQQARTQVSLECAEQMGGAAFIHPYDDPFVLAGQGTIGLELLEQHPEMDAVLVPVSGGGMIGGIALAIKALRPDVRVIACEPSGKDLAEALRQKVRVVDAAKADAALDTIADAIRTKAFGPVPWDVCASLLEPTVLAVDDVMIRHAMTSCLNELKQVVEPAGAVTLAALLSPAFQMLRDDEASSGRPINSVVAILCGGNVDVEAYAALVGGPHGLGEMDVTWSFDPRESEGRSKE